MLALMTNVSENVVIMFNDAAALVKKIIYGRPENSTIQFLRYAIGGGITTVVHLFIFLIFAWLVFPAFSADDKLVQILGLEVGNIDQSTRAINTIIANLITFIFANAVSYMFSIYWIFDPGKFKRTTEIILFYTVAGASIGLSSLFIAIMIGRFGISTTMTFAVNLVVIVAFNYSLKKYVVFKALPHLQDRPDGELTEVAD